MERYCDNDDVAHENCNVMYSLPDGSCVVLYADAQATVEALQRVRDEASGGRERSRRLEATE